MVSTEAEQSANWEIGIRFKWKWKLTVQVAGYGLCSPEEKNKQWAKLNHLQVSMGWSASKIQAEVATRSNIMVNLLVLLPDLGDKIANSDNWTRTLPLDNDAAESRFSFCTSQSSKMLHGSFEWYIFFVIWSPAAVMKMDLIRVLEICIPNFFNQQRVQTWARMADVQQDEGFSFHTAKISIVQKLCSSHSRDYLHVRSSFSKLGLGF